ncbi:hypothetical protein [Neorhizobium petrolearium]|uniref:hypothetical protein n=1 Tax=Neorhizobium petrolearium TaxID=515361 RepID=UPI003F822FFC
MIESVPEVNEASSPDSSSAPPAPASAAAAIAEMLAVGDMPGRDADDRSARPISAAAAIARPAPLHARPLGAFEDAVIFNLLDNLSPSSRIAGIVLSESEEPAPRSLITAYYEDA